MRNFGTRTRARLFAALFTVASMSANAAVEQEGDYAFSMSGDETARPLQAFYRGDETWLKMDVERALPKVSALSDCGKKIYIGGDTRIKGRYLVVAGLYGRLLFESGSQKATVRYDGTKKVKAGSDDGCAADVVTAEAAPAPRVRVPVTEATEGAKVTTAPVLPAAEPIAPLVRAAEPVKPVAVAAAPSVQATAPVIAKPAPVVTAPVVPAPLPAVPAPVAAAPVVTVVPAVTPAAPVTATVAAPTAVVVAVLPPAAVPVAPAPVALKWSFGAGQRLSETLQRWVRDTKTWQLAWDVTDENDLVSQLDVELVGTFEEAVEQLMDALNRRDSVSADAKTLARAESGLEAKFYVHGANRVLRIKEKR